MVRTTGRLRPFTGHSQSNFQPSAESIQAQSLQASAAFSLRSASAARQQKPRIHAVHSQPGPALHARTAHQTAPRCTSRIRAGPYTYTSIPVRTRACRQVCIWDVRAGRYHALPRPLPRHGTSMRTGTGTAGGQLYPPRSRSTVGLAEFENAVLVRFCGSQIERMIDI